MKPSSEKESSRPVFDIGKALPLAILPFAGLLLLAYIYYMLAYSLEEQAHAFGVLESIATISALILGGAWSYLAFFRQRLSQPRLNVKHELETICLPDGRSLIKVFACLDNVGQVLVDLNVWCLRAERILPLSSEISSFIQKRSAFTDHEALWPTVAGLEDGTLKGDAFRMLLEPGETDRAVGNLIVPADAKVVQVYSHFRMRLPTEDPGWQMQTVVNLPDRATN
jgi:hypothetical protein